MLLGHQAGEALLAHQSLHSLAADLDAVVHKQLGVDAASAIDLAVVIVDLADLLGQPRVTQRPV